MYDYETELKQKIEELKQKIEESEKRGYSTTKIGVVCKKEYDSDLGLYLPYETTGVVPRSTEEMEKSKREWETEISSLKSELRQTQNTLQEFEWNKPENKEDRRINAIIKEEKEKKDKLNQERLEHESAFEDLNRLVELLMYADMDDLAFDLSKFRFSQQAYIQKEIDLQCKEKSFLSKTKTTKKEYKEIKRNVVKLKKQATKMVKKYKDLYRLYSYAGLIIEDIEEKGIFKKQGQELHDEVEKYFTQPTSQYYFRVKGKYSLIESENLGYQILEFYRDDKNKYRQDKKNNKI